MNVEECRLRTFANWPVSAAVEANRIAAAGFFSTGSELRVQCYSCGCEISEWNYGDQVMARHRTLSPNCEFVRDPQGAGNVPLARPNSTSQASGRDEVPPRLQERMVGRWESTTTIYTSEQARLESFTDWPIPFIVRPEALAAAGFYFLHQGDKVKCAFCTGIITHWEPGDTPKDEHRRHFPNCSFILGLPVGNIPRTTASVDNVCEDISLADLGIQEHRGPRCPKYSTVESRLQTFTDWPADHPQRPIDLAQAGLYHIKAASPGFAQDQVRCFHCDGGLRNWESEDVPWREHARWFPSCQFLLLVKGRRFVEEIQRQYMGEQASAPLEHEDEPGLAENATAAAAASSALTPEPYVNEELEEHGAAALGAVGGVEALEEENRRLKDARQCKICMDAEIGTVLLPCGHLVACVTCAPSLLDCPVCRVTIKATVRTYLT